MCKKYFCKKPFKESPEANEDDNASSVGDQNAELYANQHVKDRLSFQSGEGPRKSVISQVSTLVPFAKERTRVSAVYSRV